MGHPLDLPAAVAARRVRDASDPLTAQALVTESLRRIEERDGRIHAFLATSPDLALAQAERVDRAVREGRDPGPLAGLPLAVKDNLAVGGVAMTCGSRILGSYRPPTDATAVALAVASGACVVGKTNLDEFAMGSSTENSAFGPTRNPHDLTRVPGGSSGGSAAAVAAGMVPLALGSDTGGSIRQPAAFCGIVGFKPTYGSVSRSGLVAFASSLDQVGPLARTVEDAALLHDAIAGRDADDMTTWASCLRASEKPGPDGLQGLRVGIARELDLGTDADPAVRDVVDRTRAALRSAGAIEVPVSVPLSGTAAIAIYYVIAPAEASSNLARFDGVRFGQRVEATDLRAMYEATRGRGFGAEVQRRILIGTFVLSAGYADAYYKRAMGARATLRAQFAEALGQVDVLLSATTPTVPFPLGARSGNPVEMYLCDVLTVTANLAGLPALSLPGGYSREGLPIGVQLWAAEGQDARLLRIAAATERVLGVPFRQGSAWEVPA